MHQIQMKNGNQWVTLGGKYSAAEADERVSQFMTCFSGKAAREFRVVKAADEGSEASRRFDAARTSRSPR